MSSDEFDAKTQAIINKIKEVTEGQPRAVILCALGVIKSEILQQANEEAIIAGEYKAN